MKSNCFSLILKQLLTNSHLFHQKSVKTERDVHTHTESVKMERDVHTHTEGNICSYTSL